ncbi:MAG: penicillin acylase family protein [Pirellulales bacterium]|nr:penicillin acylase family protein [Pirellulales bacterium]
MPRCARSIWMLLLPCFVLAVTSSLHAADESRPLRVCLVSGSEEYKSDETLPILQDFLERHYDVECSRAFATSTKDLPGLEALDDCDVMVLFTRRLELSGDQLERFKKYCQGNKPIVGIRTASHAIQSYLEFDREILGGNYKGHYGNELKTHIADGVQDSPLLAGFKPFVSDGSLYRNTGLAEDCLVLMTGSIPDHTEPITWTRERDGRRVFYTSLGHPHDFRHRGFLQLLANGIHWAAQHELQPRQHTALPQPANGEVRPLAGLGERADVYFDTHGIPHLYARSWTDAARALGYVHASDRLWQMDVLRRRASGTLAEILGPGALGSDIMMRQLGLRRTSQATLDQLQAGDADLAAKVGRDAAEQFLAELNAYAAGVNARIQELGTEGLPVYFKMLGYEPAPWSPVDTLVFSKYMAWDQSGTDSDLWFGMMSEKLGPEVVAELWPLDRPYEIATVDVPKGGDEESASTRELLRVPSGTSDLFRAAERHLAAAGSLLRAPSFGSNNWAVDGTKTASGKPIMANDPHLGFILPSLWYTCHVSVAGRNVAGVTFPGGPTVIIGHNDRITWGVTNMQADAVDYFIETLDKSDPQKYKHRGEWKTVHQRVEEIPIRGQEPHKLVIESTVHGPIVSRDDATGTAITMCWTGLQPTTESVALWKVNRAEYLGEFLDALKLLSAPAMNVIYSDVDGNIAIHPCGDLPLKKYGAGRVPMDGASGENDWGEMIPRDELPLAVNPREHFLGSANGRPASVNYPHYLGWMWDPSYRTRRIHELLEGADDLTLEKMQAIQTDAYDKAAECFLPSLLNSLDMSEVASDAVSKRAVDELRGWDYVADRESLAPAIWLRWFDHYRSAVWNDEWESRGIVQPGGSWGFTGDNRREPVLEVLEKLTREEPDSIWFDDRRTPEREGRDEIAKASFRTAIDSLRQQFGDDVAAWQWGKLNTLRVRSLAEQERLARDGGPIVGTAFTVNPGGDIGPVGGGASWRMLVDLASPVRGVGAYPGGQHEDPSSPQYDDQIKVWAAGEFLPLGAVGDPARLPDEAKQRVWVLAPDSAPRSP